MALGQLDAVAGRYLLMFVPDPVVALAKLSTHVRSGGPIVFHEPDWDGVRRNPPNPGYLQVCEWVRKALLRSGADDRMGTRLAAVFGAAGLTVRTLRFEALIPAGQAAPDAVRVGHQACNTPSLQH